MSETAAKRKMGRPPGAGPVAALRRELLTDGKLDKLVAKTFTLAMGGNISAIRILLDRVIAPLRSQAAPVTFALPLGTPTEQARALLAAAAAGELPVDLASELITACARLVAIEQNDEFKKRLDALDNGDLA